MRKPRPWICSTEAGNYRRVGCRKLGFAVSTYFSGCVTMACWPMKKAAPKSHCSRKRNRADDKDAHSYPSRFPVTNLSSDTSVIGSILDTDFQKVAY